MKKFECKIVTFQGKGISSRINIEKTETTLTGLGLEGWEVVSSFKDSKGGYVTLNFVLKREIVETGDT